MALVDYASSDEEEEHRNSDEVNTETVTTISPASNVKPLRDSKHDTAPSSLPPLPSKFLDLYASNVRASTRDDPSLHGGRKRTTPHVQGNWPTHLYIEWYPNPVEYELLASLVDSFRGPRYEKPLYEEDLDVQSLLTSDLGSPLPLHISLSRPLGFSTATKDAFLSSLQTAISSTDISPFRITFNGCDWASNYEGTRWFLSLRVAKPLENNLNRLLGVCNDTVQTFNKSPLYSSAASSDPGTPTQGELPIQSPSLSNASLQPQDFSSAFHISIAWTLSAPSIVSAASRLDHPQVCQLNDCSPPVIVSEIKAKIGNVVTSIPLASGRGERRGLFGA